MAKHGRTTNIKRRRLYTHLSLYRALTRRKRAAKSKLHLTEEEFRVVRAAIEVARERRARATA